MRAEISRYLPRSSELFLMHLFHMDKCNTYSSKNIQKIDKIKRKEKLFNSTIERHHCYYSVFFFNSMDKVMDINETDCDSHCVIYIYIESLCCIPKMYTQYLSIRSQ